MSRKRNNTTTIWMFGTVELMTVVDKYSKIWFRAVDIARALEYRDPQSVIYNFFKKHKDTTKTYKELLEYLPPEQMINIKPTTKFIDEQDLYSFICGSRKAKSMGFNNWIYGKILPSIRKTGKFTTSDDNNPLDIINILGGGGGGGNDVDFIQESDAFIFTQQSNCTPSQPPKDKNEYLLICRKSSLAFVACRMYEHLIESFKTKHPELIELTRLKINNNGIVNYFENITANMKNFVIIHGNKEALQSFSYQPLCPEENNENQLIEAIIKAHNSFVCKK